MRAGSVISPGGLAHLPTMRSTGLAGAIARMVCPTAASNCRRAASTLASAAVGSKADPPPTPTPTSLPAAANAAAVACAPARKGASPTPSVDINITCDTPRPTQPSNPVSQ